MNKTALIIIIIVVLILAGIAYYYLGYRKGVEEKGPSIIPSLPKVGDLEVPVDVGGEIAEAVESLVEIPSANPLKDVKNPFEEPYKNPFK